MSAKILHFDPEKARERRVPRIKADCAKCIHLHSSGEAQNGVPYHNMWSLCSAYPLPQKLDLKGHVRPYRSYPGDGERFLADVELPYHYCKDKNKDGKCPKFEPKPSMS